MGRRELVRALHFPRSHSLSHTNLKSPCAASGRSGGRSACYSIGATRPTPRTTTADATQEETEGDGRGRDSEREDKTERESTKAEAEDDASDSGSSTSPGSDIADFVEAFAARSDDY